MRNCLLYIQWKKRKAVCMLFLLILFQHAGQPSMAQSAAAKVFSGAAEPDSLHKLLMQQLQHFINSGVATGQSELDGIGKMPGQLAGQELQQLVPVTDIRHLLAPLSAMVKQPLLHWAGDNLRIEGQSAPSLFGAGPAIINSSTLNMRLAITGIPLQWQLLHQDYGGNLCFSRTRFTIDFSNSDYLNTLRNKIMEHLVQQQLLKGYELLAAAKRDALARLKTALDTVRQLYSTARNKNLASADVQWQQLKKSGLAIQDTMFCKQLLQQLAGLDGKPDAEWPDSLLQILSSAPAVKSLLEKWNELKETVHNDGWDQKLPALRAQADSLKILLQDPDKLKAMAKEQLNLNDIQKIFLQMKQLKTGMNTASLSPLSVYAYLNTGINAAFENKGNYLSVLAGRQTDPNNLADGRFTTSGLATDNTVAGIRVGKGALAGSYSHLSLFTYQQHYNAGNTISGARLPERSVVATFSRQLATGTGHYFSVEVSKSAHHYSHEQWLTDSLPPVGPLSKKLPGGNSFIAQMACSLNWTGEIKDKELDYDLQGTRIGKEYSNPGNTFLSAGTTEIAAGLRKKLLRQKLQLLWHGNAREYAYSSDNNRWRNYTFSFQGRWRYKSGQYISVSYLPAWWLRWQRDKKYAGGSSYRLTAEASIKRRFAAIGYQQQLSLSVLKNDYPADSLAANSHSILISSLQTITMNQISYYLHLQYNNAGTMAQPMIFNDRFTADAGCMYNIRKSITASSGLNYGALANGCRQAGIKQSLSGQLSDQFACSLEADIIKNIHGYAPSMVNSSRFNWTLQYSIK